MSALDQNHVVVSGPADGRPMVFAHGFGCDQGMWREVAPKFEDRYRTVLYDLLGFGASDTSAFDPERHGTLQGHAEDLLAICADLDLRDVVFVGHSVSAMIGIRAALIDPTRFAQLVLVCPSPRYIDEPETGYVGGFSRADIAGLLDTLDDNFLAWSVAMAPTIMGNADRPELGEELTDTFCRADPTIASVFARMTFLSDSRDDLPEVRVPTLVLQTSEDAIAGQQVGEYVHDHIAGSMLVLLQATGHCPNVSAPEETVAAIEAYLAEVG